MRQFLSKAGSKSNNDVRGYGVVGPNCEEGCADGCYYSCYGDCHSNCAVNCQDKCYGAVNTN